MTTPTQDAHTLSAAQIGPIGALAESFRVAGDLDNAAMILAVRSLLRVVSNHTNAELRGFMRPVLGLLADQRERLAQAERERDEARAEIEHKRARVREAAAALVGEAKLHGELQAATQRISDLERRLGAQDAVVKAVRKAWDHSYWDYDGAQTLDPEDVVSIKVALDKAALDALATTTDR